MRKNSRITAQATVKALRVDTILACMDVKRLPWCLMVLGCFMVMAAAVALLADLTLTLRTQTQHLAALVSVVLLVAEVPLHQPPRLVL
jgi:hypothetical protein